MAPTYPVMLTHPLPWTVKTFLNLRTPEQSLELQHCHLRRNHPQSHSLRCLHMQRCCFILNRVFAVVPPQTGDEAFLDGLDDVGIARAVDEEKHREFAVDFRDVALEDDLGKDGANEFLLLDILHELAVGDA
ncbi:MAG: hypothetical protein EOO74_04000, partial [Myxococcales bacterium]